MVLKREDFGQVSELFSKASVEQLSFLQEFIGAIIKDRYTSAAMGSGLIASPEPRVPMPSRAPDRRGRVTDDPNEPNWNLDDEQ